MAVNFKIIIVISLIVVDMPLVYGMLLRCEWIYEIGIVINTRMAIITFPYNKNIITLSREVKYKDLVHDRKARRPIPNMFLEVSIPILCLLKIIMVF